MRLNQFDIYLLLLVNMMQGADSYKSSLDSLDIVSESTLYWIRDVKIFDFLLWVIDILEW